MVCCFSCLASSKTCACICCSTSFCCLMRSCNSSTASLALRAERTFPPLARVSASKTWFPDRSRNWCLVRTMAERTALPMLNWAVRTGGAGSSEARSCSGGSFVPLLELPAARRCLQAIRVFSTNRRSSSTFWLRAAISASLAFTCAFSLAHSSSLYFTKRFRKYSRCAVVDCRSSTASTGVPFSASCLLSSRSAPIAQRVRCKKSLCGASFRRGPAAPGGLFGCLSLGCSFGFASVPPLASSTSA
mmetsp:Transcript_79829/g.205364  ORF Transcript_79829/g.205364 Transcript_79829/m.205364 type:complete len:246 (-) Transcript_79829:262-999(-)